MGFIDNKNHMVVNLKGNGPSDKVMIIIAISIKQT